MVFDSVPTSSSFQWIIKVSLFSIVISGLVQLFYVSALPEMSHDKFWHGIGQKLHMCLEATY